MKYLVLLSLIACANRPSGQLSKKALDLEIYPNRPTNCRVSGKIVGENFSGSTELATNDALNKAANLGATGIFINQEVPNGNKRAVHATAYTCD
jgi:hypothetical protein